MSEQEYIAVSDNEDQYYKGSLDDICETMHDEGESIDDYTFYKVGEEVEVALKIALVEKASLTINKS